MAILHPCATRMLPEAGRHSQAVERAKPGQCRVSSITQHPRKCSQPGKLGCWAWAEDTLLIWIARDPPSTGTRSGMQLCLIPQVVYNNHYKYRYFFLLHTQVPFLLLELQVSNLTSWLWHCKVKEEAAQWWYPEKAEPAKSQDTQNSAREKLGGRVRDLIPAEETPWGQNIAQNGILYFWTGLHTAGQEDWQCPPMVADWPHGRCSCLAVFVCCPMEATKPARRWLKPDQKLFRPCPVHSSGTVQILPPLPRAPPRASHSPGMPASFGGFTFSWHETNFTKSSSVLIHITLPRRWEHKKTACRHLQFCTEPLKATQRIQKLNRNLLFSVWH